MKEKKKLSTAEIIMVIFCGLGCSLMVAQKFIESEWDLFTLAITLNGIGIAALLYSMNSKKVG